MPDFTPTQEQLDILEAAAGSDDNLLISALAGAAKTSTLELIAAQLPKVNAISLAFNKRIADEMRTRLPEGYTVKTLNALGHAIWGQTIGKRLSLRTGKSYELLKEALDRLPPKEAEEARDSFSFILKSVGELKGAGWVPDTYRLLHPKRRPDPLVNDDEAFDSLSEEPTKLEWQLILEVYSEGLEQAFEGLIDFNDQLLMPSVFRAIYPIFSLILVDEAQDLSELNFRMLQRLYRKRIIAVGDQCQAIYGFRGASSNGMSAMKKLFDMTELNLSCSFRCPPAVVEAAKWRAPHMTAWHGNPHPGEVRHLPAWSLEDLPDNAAVICRNNAPLFSLAIKLLQSGRYPNLWGNDIGKGLIQVMKKLGPANMTIEDAFEALDQWAIPQRKRARNRAYLEDRLLSIRIFFRAASTLGGAIHYAEHLLRSEGRVHFMTGHKAKGHEFDDVFFLDEELVRDEGQDLNLRYVIITRAKQRLTYIRSVDLAEEEMVE